MYDLSSGEKRKALIDVAYSFLVRSQERDKQIILAVDEPDASLHISACYEQFSRLFELVKLGHQIIITTHWYGYLPIISEGSATSMKKTSANEVDVNFFDLYNYREKITQDRKKINGILPYDISLKSHNDLVQSITYSLIGASTYNWLICEGISEKIYFEHIFSDKILDSNLKILPVGGYKEVKKIYESLISPMNDPDYSIKGTVYCLIDTDTEILKVEVKSIKNLYFKRLLNKQQETELVNIDSNASTPPTEIEDCLNPKIYFKTLQSFADKDEDIKNILATNEYNSQAKVSGDTLDLKPSQQKLLKGFFDKNMGMNKVLFAKQYVEISNLDEFDKEQEAKWITDIKSTLKKSANPAKPTNDIKPSQAKSTTTNAVELSSQKIDSKKEIIALPEEGDTPVVEEIFEDNEPIIEEFFEDEGDIDLDDSF
ncbi:ATP-binding protein [Hymenobacter tibetensis]|uniref:ATP-binding protein n=1 Tax=Hymenobacter tibetensis TaxID=497967 RepID=A0ABY4CZR2_9BACT|nr:AAA family ATPase [Hymenobacter tibetensis]UOG75252.1 ATP-binding protein [Hymenobacter tibetensis]